MPVNLQDLKNKTRGTASTIIADNQSSQQPQAPVAQTEGEEKSVSSLIGKPKVFENLFSRQTFYVHNDFIKTIDKMAKKGGKGAKTRIINEALEMYLQSKKD